LTFFCLLLAAPLVSAESDTDRARGHFEAGAEHYYEGEYARALIEFKRGHELVPNSLFVYNMSLCHLRLGQYAMAFEKAVRARESGDLPEKEGLRNAARIPAMSAVLTSRQIASDIENEPDDGAGRVEEDIVAESKDGSPGALGYTGIAIIGVGAAALVWALFIDASLSTQWDDYRASVAEGETARAETIRGEMESDQSTAQILVFAGAGGVLVGAALLGYDLWGEVGSSIAVVPRQDGVSASATFRF